MDEEGKTIRGRLERFAQSGAPTIVAVAELVAPLVQVFGEQFKRRAEQVRQLVDVWAVRRLRSPSATVLRATEWSEQDRARLFEAVEEARIRWENAGCPLDHLQLGEPQEPTDQG
jgi:hypothetical protein